MNNEVIIEQIKNHLSKRWKYYFVNGKEVYRKKDSPKLNLKKQPISTGVVYNRLSSYLQDSIAKEFHYNSIINQHADTDYIIAGFQVINEYIERGLPLKADRLYYFQPVIRSVPVGKGIPDGLIRTFTNVGTFFWNAQIDDYFNELEMWITALSKCSIYADALELQIKNKTNSYNGVGIRFLVENTEIGQGNIYIVSVSNRECIVLDFGFGLERIVWATNGFSEFASICAPKIDIIYGKEKACLLISEFVLLALSGVKLDASKYGLKMKHLISEIIRIEPRWNYYDALDYYYSYWTAFMPNVQVDKATVRELITKGYRSAVSAILGDRR